jgi:uncharacterized membrane protein
MNLTFAGETWLWPALAVVGMAAIILAWSYWTYRAFPLRWVCLGLKLLGIAALAFCLLEPLRSSQRVRPGANLFALVADNSQGLQIKDAGETRNRGELLHEWLSKPTEGWEAVLAENFDIRRYQFDARLQAVTDFSDLTFDGRSSAIGSAMRTIAERMKGSPLAGVLLFTDGNATDLGGAAPDLRGLPPVYPVVVGRNTDIKDISLTQISVSQSAFEDQPVVIQAEASAVGFGGQRMVAKLREPSGRTIVEETKPIRSGKPVPFRLQPRPDEGGLLFYELQVVSQNAASVEPAASDAVDEATLANNSRTLAVDRGGGPYRILYVCGRPNWEFKFLNRAVEPDPQLQLIALIRVAKREPKFDFRGRAGETSNPLYRGFDKQAPEDVERFDQPVLIPMNTRDEFELRSGFPRTAEDLFDYHAIILDDLEAAFFGPDQAALLQRFVSERGGGVLMLGGMESFREGGYYRTPVGDMLPVYLDRSEPMPSETSLRFHLAREGWLEPWARVRDQEDAERQRLDEMPAFRVANRVSSVKPGASIIATGKDSDGTEVPTIVVQRFGRGRTGAVLIGDLWRWGMRDTTARADLEKSWRQLLRWLVADVPERCELNVEPIPADPLGAVNLEVRVRNPKFEPLDNARVMVEVAPVLFEGSSTDSATNRVQLRAEPSPSEPGLYTATFLPRTSGGFRATATVTNEVGAEYGRDETGWAHNPAADEFRSLVPNVALLESIAQKTGGEVLQADELDRLVSKLPLRSAPVMESWTFPIWHTAAMFAFALACFLAEWGLRRWNGMP